MASDPQLRLPLFYPDNRIDYQIWQQIWQQIWHQIWHQMNPKNVSVNPQNMSSEIKANNQQATIQELSNV